MRHRRGRQQIAQSAREGRRGSRAFRPPRARSAAVLARLRRVNALQSHIHRHLGGRHGARRGAVQRGAVRCSAAQRGDLPCLWLASADANDQSCQKVEHVKSTRQKVGTLAAQRAARPLRRGGMGRADFLAAAAATLLASLPSAQAYPSYAGCVHPTGAPSPRTDLAPATSCFAYPRVEFSSGWVRFGIKSDCRRCRSEARA